MDCDRNDPTKKALKTAVAGEVAVGAEAAHWGHRRVAPSD